MTSTTAHTTGTIGIAATVALAVLNLAHPFTGSTDLYGDAVEFMEGMNTWWIIVHLALGVAVLFVPLVGWAWVQSFNDERARVWGRLAWMTLVAGTAIGVVHLVGIDGVALPSFREVVEATDGAPAEVAAAAALLRVHLTTFVSWLIVFWFGASLFLGVARLIEPGAGRWLGAVLLLVAVLVAASATVTALEGQLTTLSEPGLFRPASFLFTAWLLIASVQLRRTPADVEVSATPAAGS